MLWTTAAAGDDAVQSTTYRRFTVVESDGRVVATQPIPEANVPRWARDVPQQAWDWSSGPDADTPYFAQSLPFVLPPADEGEPFYSHNHQPAITWLPNGDLLGIWYSTESEVGPELTVLASRLRAGRDQWDPSSEFFKAADRNMHGSALFHDGRGTIYHFNGMSSAGSKPRYKELALLMRTSRDNGVTWTPPQAIGPQIKGRHQVIAGTIQTRGGVLIQPCDAAVKLDGGTALHISHDGGKTWTDPGADQPGMQFALARAGRGEGAIAGVHAGVVELSDGRLLSLGRGDAIDRRMPMSLSADLGQTWIYKASPFPRIAGGQRLVLMRLREGPLLLVSFTSDDRRAPEAEGMTFADSSGKQFVAQGVFAALSFDEGETWHRRKLIRRTDTTRPKSERAGYLAATQPPDGVIHLISSHWHYRFNLAWLTADE